MGFRKKKKKSANEPLNLELPPGPLPPMPGMPLPLPEVAPLPLDQELPQLSDIAKPNDDPSERESGNNYNKLWAKKSEKSLPQIYGHIDRISTGEVGSLLDRYADRFGHSLDRDIIVLRKQQHDEKLAQIRDAPVVELIDDNKPDTTNARQITDIEDEIRALKPSYQEAKNNGDSTTLAELKPKLEILLKERKKLLASIAAETVEDTPSDDNNITESTVQETAQTDLSDEQEITSKPVIAQEAIEEDLFAEFVSIVDELLGSNLPSEIVETFVASDDFSIYQKVGMDPESADDELRSLFFAIVDNQLGNMDEKSIEDFVSSSNFKIYSEIGEMYQ